MNSFDDFKNQLKQNLIKNGIYSELNLKVKNEILNLFLPVTALKEGFNDELMGGLGDDKNTPQTKQQNHHINLLIIEYLHFNGLLHTKSMLLNGI